MIKYILRVLKPDGTLADPAVGITGFTTDDGIPCAQLEDGGYLYLSPQHFAAIVLETVEEEE